MVLILAATNAGGVDRDFKKIDTIRIGVLSPVQMAVGMGITNAAKMAADQTTQEWWAVMMPMQEPLPTRKPGEWWAEMEEVFHVD
jgi:hypothetical protein